MQSAIVDDIVFPSIWWRRYNYVGCVWWKWYLLHILLLCTCNLFLLL